MTQKNLTKQFHIGDILSITTDTLLAPSGMSGVYAILNFVTQDSIFTHQIPRAIQEAKPYILRQFPQLNGVTLPADLGGEEAVKEEAVKEWVEQQAERFGEWHEVAPMAQDDHQRIDPVEELSEKMGRDRVIVVPSQKDE